jgi:predicted RNA-binding protein Jag
MTSSLTPPFGIIGQKRSEQNQQKEKNMYIGNDTIGSIIGYSGKTVNKLRKLTNAKINISNYQDKNGNRKITIIGIENDIKKIEDKILHLLKI